MTLERPEVSARKREHVEAAERERLDREEVAGDHRRGVGANELTAARRIENEAAVRDVIALLRLNERVVGRHGLPDESRSFV